MFSLCLSVPKDSEMCDIAGATFLQEPTLRMVGQQTDFTLPSLVVSGVQPFSGFWAAFWGERSRFAAFVYFCTDSVIPKFGFAKAAHNSKPSALLPRLPPTLSSSSLYYCLYSGTPPWALRQIIICTASCGRRSPLAPSLRKRESRSLAKSPVGLGYPQAFLSCIDLVQ